MLHTRSNQRPRATEPSALTHTHKHIFSPSRSPLRCLSRYQRVWGGAQHLSVWHLHQHPWQLPVHLPVRLRTLWQQTPLLRWEKPLVSSRPQQTVLMILIECDNLTYLISLTKTVKEVFVFVSHMTNKLITVLLFFLLQTPEKASVSPNSKQENVQSPRL